MLAAIQDFFASHWKLLVELVVVAVSVGLGYRFLRERSSGRTLAGLIFLVSVFLLAQVFGFNLIQNVALVLSIALLIIFQPELRRSFVDLGSHGLFASTKGMEELVDQLQQTVRQLSAKRYGALFALERGMELDSYLETGVKIDSLFSQELVMSVFHPKTALHDGGMILRKMRIEGAGCVFPISQRELSDRSIGLRHRAGMGITEESDAISVIVSEETGHISICSKGELEQDLTLDELKERLSELLAIAKEEADDDTADADDAEEGEDTEEAEEEEAAGEDPEEESGGGKE